MNQKQMNPQQLTELCELLLTRSEELVVRYETMRRLLVRHGVLSQVEFDSELKLVQIERRAHLAAITESEIPKALASFWRQWLATVPATKQ